MSDKLIRIQCNELWISECGTRVQNDNSGVKYKIQTTKGGYCQIQVTNSNGDRKTLLVHRLVAMAFVPNPYGKPCVNHLDGDKTNNRSDNLEWVTKSENTRHAYSTGLLKDTGKKENKKRNDAMRELHGTGKYTHQDLADIFSMTAPNVTRILNYKRAA